MQGVDALKGKVVNVFFASFCFGKVDHFLIDVDTISKADLWRGLKK